MVEKLGKRALLADCMAQCLSAANADDLEANFQASLQRLRYAYGGDWFSRGYRAASSRLRREAVIPRGWQLVASHPLGRFIPTLGPRRKMTVLGEVYSVGYGGNGAGERYAWHYAKTFARDKLSAAGLTEAEVESVWSWVFSWPHRALRALAESRTTAPPEPSQ